MSACCGLHNVESPCGVDFCCRQCPADRVNLPGFLEHQIRLAEFLSAYVCEICGSVTTNDKTAQLHVRAHEMEAEAATEQGDDPCESAGCTPEVACLDCRTNYWGDRR